VTSPSSPTKFYTADAYVLDESVGYVMKRVLTSVVQQADISLEPHGVTHAQWYALFKLCSDRKPMAVAELARELQMDTGAMTRLLDRLERKGLCKRVRSTKDRRVVMIRPTPEGESTAALIPAVVSEVLNAHLAGFSEVEWRTLMGYLRRMLENGDKIREARISAHSETSDAPLTS